LGYHVVCDIKDELVMKLSRFAWYAWGVLACNILVILWGAFVRASGSGAGCGSHWPTCQGEVIPWAAQTATLIEFGHRVMSGLDFVLVLGLLIWAFRSYPRGHWVRWGAGLSFVFIITEALIGAGLVLFALVAKDSSMTRAVAIAGHLVNTFILLAVLTLTAWWASPGGKPVKLKNAWLNTALGLGFGALLVTGASGAVIALGDTLFPATSLSEGLQQKFSPTAHFLVHLRPYHPLVAIIVGIYLILIAGIFNSRYNLPTPKKFARLLTNLYFVQLGAGALNVVLLAPIWMQFLHLGLSDAILIVWVLFMATALAEEAPQAEPLLKPNLQTHKELFH
jgi:heme A synthase